ncbi:MlaD family protein [Nocardioides sp. B-3]|uniref:MlaD family protein n=1 Tax=Nocardioides sp. B-3 TaxID=2895565 RepID=UPI002152791F|nr:MlaD family protein [Nocardioides sp. B-3]UUZ60660.1 MlaD family protein [Nocardioides sp. B-3]
MSPMIPFHERNPVVIGAISLAMIAASLAVAFRAGDLPVIGGGDTYYAAFSESGGLKVNDEVRIAGVRVGKVDSVELDGDHVKVAFKVDSGEEFGPTTNAAIKVKTLLGAMFLSLEPAGAGQMEEESTIPVERTTSPYDVVSAFEGPAATSEEINTDQLAESLTTLADLTRNTPRGVPRGPRRCHPALGQRRGARRRDQHPAGQPGEGLQGARRARRGHRGADA